MRTAIGGGGNPQQSGACVVSYDTKRSLSILPSVVGHFGWYAHFPVGGKIFQRQLSQMSQKSDPAACGCRVGFMHGNLVAWFVSRAKKEICCRCFDPYHEVHF